ncbi:MAG: LytS/YehU family sensor histidine kinase [Crocinitomix sp.]|jgi:LytS/YehU family sensor histidine kinase
MLMRRILHNVKLHSVLLSDEIDTITLYLDLEVLRLGERFSYEINCSSLINADFVKIPPMIIQPFIENSIWHGIMNRDERNGKVIISFHQKGDYLCIEILDDGVGRKRAKELQDVSDKFRKSTGLKSISRRMQVLNEIYKTRLSYKIEDLEDEFKNALGTKITLNIPIDYA